jgi:hypothetical protein
MVPDPWQIEVLRSTSDRLLLNCSRQSGKSTVAALLAVHVALYDPGALVLLLSPSERQSGELFKKALVAYRTMGRPVPAEAENALSLALENGSRIVSLPGTAQTIRGYSAVRALIIDEAAQVEDSLYASVRPMLAVSGGRLIAMSTPFGKRGWFYEAWRGDERWQRIQVTAHECPRIPAAFLEEERRVLGPWAFASEYECTFLDVDIMAFPSDDVARAVTEVEWWEL